MVAGRLAELPQNLGVRPIEPLIRSMQPGEGKEFGIPPGTEIPQSVRRVVERTYAGTVEELIARGVVPSAEVLARLVPQIAATATTAAYPDEALRTLMAATYEAFRRRRSLLLLNLAHQVTLAELPWVAAVEPYRRAVLENDSARAGLVRLGELALDGFPATVPPKPLIRELDALSRAAGLDLFSSCR